MPFAVTWMQLEIITLSKRNTIRHLYVKPKIQQMNIPVKQNSQIQQAVVAKGVWVGEERTGV